jgi:hypothetical protein
MVTIKEDNGNCAQITEKIIVTGEYYEEIKVTYLLTHHVQHLSSGAFSKGEKWYDKLFNVKYLPLFHHFKAISQFPKHIIVLVKIVANGLLTANLHGSLSVINAD